MFSAKKEHRESKLLIHVHFIDMVIILQVVKSEVIDFSQTNKLFRKHKATYTQKNNYFEFLTFAKRHLVFIKIKAFLLVVILLFLISATLYTVCCCCLYFICFIYFVVIVCCVWICILEICSHINTEILFVLLLG